MHSIFYNNCNGGNTRNRLVIDVENWLIEVSIWIMKELHRLTILNMTTLHMYRTLAADLIGKCRWALKEKRRGNLRCGIICCFTRTIHLLTHHHNFTSTECHPKCRVLNCYTVFARPGPSDFYSDFLFQNWRIYERTEIFRWRTCYPHCKWLTEGPRSRIRLQWNPSFGKTLGQMHFSLRELAHVDCWLLTNLTL